MLTYNELSTANQPMNGEAETHFCLGSASRTWTISTDPIQKEGGGCCETETVFIPSQVGEGPLGCDLWVHAASADIRDAWKRRHHLHVGRDPWAFCKIVFMFRLVAKGIADYSALAAR